MPDVEASPPPGYQQPFWIWLVEYQDDREPGSHQVGAFTSQAEAQKLLDHLDTSGSTSDLRINMVPVHHSVEDWEWDR